MPLFREVQPGDRLRIGETVIDIEQKTGQRTRLRIDSPLDIEHVKAGAKLAMSRPEIPVQRPAAKPSDDTPKPRLTMPQIPLPA